MSTYLTHSVSESLHSSLTAPNHDQKKQHPHLKEESDKGHKKDEVSLIVQCLLSMVFIAIDLSTAFGILYCILFLQFLGVPTNLVSSGGIICGCSTITLLPIIGWFSDGGPNPVKRKIGVMGLGFSAYCLGYIGIIFCSAMKLNPTNTFKTNSSFENVHGGFQSQNLSSQVKYHVLGHQQMSDTLSLVTDSGKNLLPSPLWSTSQEHLSNGTHAINMTHGPSISGTNGEFTYISVIGIISFSLQDIGFDSSMSLCRAFVLECTPPALHSRLLLMATTFGAFASCLMAFAGTFDIPGAFERMYPVDGTPATMLLFSCSILIIQIVCFSCTVVTGYMITRGKHKDQKGMGDDNFTDSEKRCEMSISNGSLSTEDISNQTTDLSEPLLPLDCKLTKTFYQSVGSVSSGRQSAMVRKDTSPTVLPDNEGNMNGKVLDTNRPDKNKTRDGYSDDGSSDNESQHSAMPRPDSEDESDDESVQDDEHKDRRQHTGIPAMFSTLVNSYSASMSMALSNYIASTAAGLDRWKHNEEPTQSTDSKIRPIWKNKRFLILCGSVFFSAASLLSFMQFGGNALTIGVYHGDPVGLLGSPGRKLYDKGLRQVAVGFLVCALSQMTCSVTMKKLVDRIGHSVVYCLCHIVYIGVTMTWVLAPTEEMYFVTVVGTGFHRTGLYSSAYVMANKILQDDSAAEDGSSNKSPKNVGQVMLLIGMMIPSSYLIISIVMGPLMSATNNPFVPIIYGSVSAGLSLMVFSLLFVVKK